MARFGIVLDQAPCRNGAIVVNRVMGNLPGILLGPSPRGSCSTMRAHNILRGLAATLCTAAVICGAINRASAIDPAQAAGRRQPHSAGAVKAFAAVRGWLDQFDVPKMDDAHSQLPVDGAAAACVILRRQGRVVGVGVDVAGDDLMIRRAAGRALNEALGDPALKSLSARVQKMENQPREAEPKIDALRTDFMRGLTLELELAGDFTPLVGRTTAHMARRLEPGLDGVALRQGEEWHTLFPAQMRAANTGADPEQTILSLGLQAGIALKDLPDLAQRVDVSLYGFRTLHLAQIAPAEAPFEAFRGDVLVPFASVNRESIARFADGLANHLLASMWPEPPPPVDEQPGAPHPVPPPAGAPAAARHPLGIMGDYQVVSDQYEPLIAPPLDQGLAALALLEYAAAPGGNASLAASAGRAAEQILRDLEAVADGEADPRNDPVACASIICAISARPELRKDPTIARVFVHAGQRVLEAFEPASGFVNRLDPDGQTAFNPNGQALLALAHVRLLPLATDVGRTLEPGRVRQALDAAWGSVTEPQRVALLPWIGWAEQEFADSTDQPLARVDDLRQLLERLEASRIGASGRPGPPDVHGGFVFNVESAGPSSSALPDAQSVRPAAWVAGILAHAQVIWPEQAAEMRPNHLQTMRFLLQLAVREEHRGQTRSPQRALGGIRQSLWNSEQAVPAQALGLIAAARTLHALEQPPNNPPD